MSEIVRNTPVWVWPMLAALLALGVSQLRTRRVGRTRLMVLPLVLAMLGLASALTTFAAVHAAQLAWGLSLAGSAYAASRLVRTGRASWDAAAGELRLPGSWLPLALIVTLFTLRYSAAVALAMHPAWRSAPEVLVPLATAYGLLAGGFLGRAFALLRLTQARTAPIAA